MNSLKLTLKSLANRKFSVLLTILSIAVGVLLLLGVERIRESTRQGFEGTISQTDLIVGARGSPLQILLYSVFHIGNPLNNVSYESFSKYANHTDVSWAVPISLGDSHRGYRVVGTTTAFFDHVRVAGKRELRLESGQKFSSLLQVVIGAEVAERLRYKVGKKILLTHGLDATNSFRHENAPFEVVGVLAPTGTPFDKSLFVSLEAIEAIHEGWQGGYPTTRSSAAQLAAKKWTPQQITAFFLGLKSRMLVFKMQSEINRDADEPLTSFMPGITLRELWNTLGKAEVAFRILGGLVLVTNLLTLLLVLLSSLQERRREMAIYRALGAGAFYMGRLLLLETVILTVGGIVVGLVSLGAAFYVLATPLEKSLGFSVPVFSLSPTELIYLACILGGAMVTAVIPALISYRQSLSDGLSVRV